MNRFLLCSIASTLLASPYRTEAAEAEPRDASPKAGGEVYIAVVSHDVSGNYKDLQSAINAAPDNGKKPFRILVKPGRYEGQFIMPKEKKHIELIGEDVTNTVLTYSLNQNESPVPDGKLIYNNAGTVVLGDDFHAENITFQNTFGDHGQALAMRVDGDRAVFNHCRLLGWQDTLMLNNARQYFTNCYVEGRVDFIYGSATAVFDRCEIHSKNGGHITAASTPPEKPFGFVFLGCKLTGDSTPWMNPTNTAAAKPLKKPMADLGRPWRPFASVTYVRCEMGDHIKPAGWDNWRNPTNELTARFSEFNSTGPGGSLERRVKWSKQLTKDEAKNLTVKNILAGSDGWWPVMEGIK